MIRVAVADDHPVVREGLAAILEVVADFRVVGSVGSAEELLESARRTRPDVVLLDLELPRVDGVEAIARLREALPECRVIVFTAYDTDEKVVGAIRSGAMGYLLKGASASQIIDAVRAVYAGNSYLGPGIAEKAFAGRSQPAGAAGLSAREREVLRLVGKGRSNKEIARILAISARTVKFHLTSIMNKLGADNRAQAVALAAQRGIL